MASMTSWKQSRRKISVINTNGERIRRISRSEASLAIKTKTEVIVEDSGSSSGGENYGFKPIFEENQKRRKNGFIAQVPYVYAELSKRLSRKKRKKSSKFISSDALAKLKLSDTISDILRLAVRDNNVERLTTILKQDTTCVNSVATRGVTCLHEAAFDGYLGCIKILVLNGADVTIKDSEGYTCLDYSVLTGHFDCASYLANQGAATTNVRDGLFGLKL